jgi:hypothetical protein
MKIKNAHKGTEEIYEYFHQQLNGFPDVNTRIFIKTNLNYYDSQTSVKNRLEDFIQKNIYNLNK